MQIIKILACRNVCTWNFVPVRFFLIDTGELAAHSSHHGLLTVRSV
jgi:hypothetical protein